MGKVMLGMKKAPPIIEQGNQMEAGLSEPGLKYSIIVSIQYPQGSASAERNEVQQQPRPCLPLLMGVNHSTEIWQCDIIHNVALALCFNLFHNCSS